MDFLEDVLIMRNIDIQMHAIIELYKLVPEILYQTCQVGRVSGEYAELYDTNLIWMGSESGILSREKTRLVVF